MDRAPLSDEFEVSIFGPGWGEAIAVHVGRGEWLLADSCRNPDDRSVMSVSYLNSIGVDASSAVKWIVASHWDDDHVRGLAETVDICEAADFYCSSALRAREVLAVIGQYGRGAPGGASELRLVLDLLANRAKTVHLVGPDRLIGRSGSGDLPGFEIYSLGPSDQAVLQAIAAVGKLAMSDGVRRLYPAWPTANLTSIALLVRFDTTSIILGADLEGDDIGWPAVLRSSLVDSINADVFKVPHHGSSDAYVKQVWEDLIAQSPIAAVTPYRSSRSPLPSDAGLKQICAHADQVWLTAPRTRPEQIQRDRTVEKTMRDVVKDMHRAEHRHGQIRCRWRRNSGWEVEALGVALSHRCAA
jgi:hypothetical protein